MVFSSMVFETLRMSLNITDSYRQLPIIPAGLVRRARLPGSAGADLKLEFLIRSNGGLTKRIRKTYLQVQPPAGEKGNGGEALAV